MTMASPDRIDTGHIVFRDRMMPHYSFDKAASIISSLIDGKITRASRCLGSIKLIYNRHLKDLVNAFISLLFIDDASVSIY